MWFLTKINHKLNYIIDQGEFLMATMKEVLDKLDAVATATNEYIAKRDAIDEKLRIDLNAALASSSVSADEQADIDDAFEKADAELARLTPPIPPVV